MAKTINRIGIVLMIAMAFQSAAANGQESDKPKPAVPRRPNIVFILVDELGANDLGCYGSKRFKTPNIDKLAESGARFSAAYSSTPEAAATESAIWSGLPHLRPKAVDTGYRPDDVSGHLLLHPEQTVEPQPELRWKLNSDGVANASYQLASAKELGSFRPFISSSPLEFIASKKNRPFFVSIRFNIRGNGMEMIDAAVDAIKNAEVTGGKDLEIAFHQALLKNIDSAVGQIMAKLDESRIRGETLVVFTAASGGPHFHQFKAILQNEPYRAGSGFLYEGGLRVPLIVSWPDKIKSNIVDATPVTSADLAPTLFASIGSKSEANRSGVSLLDLLVERKNLTPRALCWHYPYYTLAGGRPAGAIRDGAWKLIEHYENGACELYNLDRDPGEITDLAAKEPGRVADLRGKLEKWRRDLHIAPLRPNPKFSAASHKELFEDVDVSRIAPGKEPPLETLKSWRSKMNDVLALKAYRTEIPAPRGGTRVLFPFETDKDVDKQPKPGVGAVILHAKDAKVHGEKLRYEPQPNKDTLGFWVNKDDWLEWTFRVPRSGMFDVELLQACGKGSGGAEIEVSVGGKTLTMKVEETGHFQRFVPRTIGRVELDASKPTTLTVRARTKPGPAVMDLRSVVLKDAIGKIP